METDGSHELLQVEGDAGHLRAERGMDELLGRPD